MSERPAFKRKLDEFFAQRNLSDIWTWLMLPEDAPRAEIEERLDERRRWAEAHRYDADYATEAKFLLTYLGDIRAELLPGEEWDEESSTVVVARPSSQRVTRRPGLSQADMDDPLAPVFSSTPAQLAVPNLAIPPDPTSRPQVPAPKPQRSPQLVAQARVTQIRNAPDGLDRPTDPVIAPEAATRPSAGIPSRPAPTPLISVPPPSQPTMPPPEPPAPAPPAPAAPMPPAAAPAAAAKPRRSGGLGVGILIGALLAVFVVLGGVGFAWNRFFGADASTPPASPGARPTSATAATVPPAAPPRTPTVATTPAATAPPTTAPAPAPTPAAPPTPATPTAATAVGTPTAPATTAPATPPATVPATAPTTTTKAPATTATSASTASTRSTATTTTTKTTTAAAEPAEPGCVAKGTYRGGAGDTNVALTVSSVKGRGVSGSATVTAAGASKRFVFSGICTESNLRLIANGDTFFSGSIGSEGTSLSGTLTADGVNQSMSLR
jgi:cytoskeletal protein RodZ